MSAIYDARTTLHCSRSRTLALRNFIGSSLKKFYWMEHYFQLVKKVRCNTELFLLLYNVYLSFGGHFNFDTAYLFLLSVILIRRQGLLRMRGGLPQSGLQHPSSYKDHRHFFSSPGRKAGISSEDCPDQEAPCCEADPPTDRRD